MLLRRSSIPKEAKEEQDPQNFSVPNIFVAQNELS